ncbi:hypothetical protein GE061_003401 [Apolygus lucorum]|uniref:C2H2-type domain-containing protein n=1 Tax=Apolygus lucorum TaxID=248454 RepID=A0A8S9X3F7_APOLU|nr:hypothetical protein GE061_003401 [Apolygus lucorum]
MPLPVKYLIPGGSFHAKRFACGMCQRTYTTKSNLVRHLKFECGKDPQFECPVCPYKAKIKDNLKAHIATKHYRSGGEYIAYHSQVNDGLSVSK